MKSFLKSALCPYSIWSLVSEAHSYLSSSTIDHAEMDKQPEDKHIEFISLFSGLRDRDYFLQVMVLALIVSNKAGREM